MIKYSRILLLATIFLILTAHPILAYVQPKVSAPIYSPFDGLRGILSPYSGGTSDGPFALWINPAYLATGRIAGLSYLHTYRDSTFTGDNAFALSLGHLGFGVELLQTISAELTSSGRRTESYSTRRYTIATATRLAKALYAGASYAWYSSELGEIDKASTWTIGLLFEPSRRLSLNLSGRDLNSPKYRGIEYDPIFQASLGLRPFKNTFTLFCKWSWRTRALKAETSQPQSYLSYGAQFELARGLALGICADEDGNIAARLGISIGNLAVSPIVLRESRDHKSGEITGATLLTLDKFWNESIFERKSYVEIDLDGRISEMPQPMSLLGTRKGLVLTNILNTIEYAKQSSGVKAIVLRCGNIGASLAVLDELRQAILDFRKSGKKVVAYLENPGSATYYLASSADYIVLVPNGYIGLVGFKTEALFLRGTLEKIGVEAKYARVGKYKSAVEPLTRDSYSEPSREALNAVLDDMYEKFIDDIASAKGWTVSHTRTLIDSGPYLPPEAIANGLVDTLAYWDEIPAILRNLTGSDLKQVKFKEFAKRLLRPSSWGEPPTIGIIYGVGGIMNGKNRRDILAGTVMGSETICEAFRQMREDNSVKAIVFRVDSPGGLMTASDKIRHEVEITSREKPVIVSMGGVAASGGYHISCAASKIIADYTTVTGSIGVLSLWLHTRGFYEKIGANKEVFVRGKNADFYPTWRQVTDEDMKRIQWYVDRFYDQFIKDVAKGRRMGVDEVNSIAQGRIWSGKQAHQIGLVDEIGGLQKAIQEARSEAGIAKDQPVRYKILPKPKGLLSALTSAFRLSKGENLYLHQELDKLVRSIGYVEAYDEPFLYLMPYTIELE